MLYKRADRVGELILQEVSQMILSEVKDPRIGFVTLTGVDVTDDLEHATIYISILGDKKVQEKTLNGLKSATGFIRCEIGKRIRLRITPKIVFKIDHSIEYGARINQLLNELQK